MSEAARIIGISEQRVRQLDGLLRPLRSPWRSYDRARVERFAAERAQVSR